MSKDKHQRIDSKMLEEALDRHAEALFKRRAGSDATPYKQNHEVAGLFQLNKQLHAALVPVEPSDAFMEQLRVELMSAHQSETHRRQRIRPVQQKRSLAQTAFSVFTAATVIARILAPFVVVIAFILARRRRASSAPA
jgi:hypothetical protein